MKSEFKLRQKIAIAVCLTGLVLQPALCHAQSVQKKRLNVDELQWVLGVTEAQWSKELQTLAQYLENKNYKDADALLDNWLQQDFDSAMLALPEMTGIVFHFKEYSLAPIFAKHLLTHEGPERINTLALLNLSNHAVHHVGVRVMQDWWQKDQESMKQWIKLTSCFFEEAYFESFLKAIQPLEKDPSSLAMLFYSLDETDIRRSRFFSQIIEDWINEDISAASAFALELYQSSDSKQNSALDRVAAEISYRLANSFQYKESLQWASRVENTQMRELAIRDHSLSVTQPADKKIFLDLLKTLPFTSQQLLKEIKEKLNTISDENS